MVVNLTGWCSSLFSFLICISLIETTFQKVFSLKEQCPILPGDGAVTLCFGYPRRSHCALCVFTRREDVKKSRDPNFPPEFRRLGFGEEVPTPAEFALPCPAVYLSLSQSSTEPNVKCPLQARHSSHPPKNS